MGRPKNLIPIYRLHKSSGQAVAFVNRKPVYLGKYGTPESKRRYSELLTSLAVETDPAQVVPAQPKCAISIAELALAYMTKELPRFSRAEQHCQKTVIRLLVQLFGEIGVKEFGPLKLRIARDAMIAGDQSLKKTDGTPSPRPPWSRRTVNRQVKRIRAIFRWGVSWELVPGSVVQDLDTLRSLRVGETAAEESKPRLAVPQDSIDAVRAALRPHHRDVFDLLLLCGARPGEVLNLTVGEIDRTHAVWKAKLKHHKTIAHGKDRTLRFNSEAQEILRGYLEGKGAEDRVFKLRRDNFGAVIRRACKRAGVTPFVPHQLRHTVATQLVDEVGLEATQQLLGHSTPTMTAHYARGAEKRALTAVEKLSVR